MSYFYAIRNKFDGKLRPETFAISQKESLIKLSPDHIRIDHEQEDFHNKHFDETYELVFGSFDVLESVNLIDLILNANC